MAFMKRRFLFEADDDADAGGGDNTADNEGGAEDSGDTGDDGGDASNDDNKGTDNNEGDTESEGEKEDIDGDQNDEEENFDIDSEEDEQGEEGENDEGASDDSADDDSIDDSSGGADSEEKQMDQDMFETLSDAEKKQKTEVLKKLYLELYNRCDAIIDQYDATIDRYDELTPIGKKVIQVLYDLKTYISDYVTKIFDSKSYMQNDTMYGCCLSVLNGIRMVTKDVAKMMEKQEE